MIVKDKEAIVHKANEASWDAFKLVINASNEISPEDDPAEYLYFIAHFAAFIQVNAYQCMENYSQIYGIELDKKKAQQWINEIVKETLKSK